MTKQKPTLVIDANRRSLSLGLKELFQYQDLFLVLAYRDLRVRYAQTFLGLLWAVIQPVSTLLIFTLLFGKAIKIDTGGVPYPFFAVTGMALWTYFSFVMSNSGQSIIQAQNMIKKVYFPRLVIPLSKALVGLVDFAIVFALLIVLAFYYDITLSENIWWVPAFILLNVLCALGVGVWLSALTVRFRDFQHIVPFVVQFGLYATPVGFPAKLIADRLPDWAAAIYYLNPMAGIIEGFRWALIGTEAPGTMSYLSFGMVLLLFVSGLYYFKRVEKVMPDIV